MPAKLRFHVQAADATAKPKLKITAIEIESWLLLRNARSPRPSVAEGFRLFAVHPHANFKEKQGELKRGF